MTSAFENLKLKIRIFILVGNIVTMYN